MPGPSRSDTSVFDPDLALRRCYGDPKLLREMIDCFLGEVDDLVAQTLAAFDRGDLLEVGRLGHRLKGSLVYLGVEAAEQAARRVEDLRHRDPTADPEGAVLGLWQQCKLLQSVLAAYRARSLP